jgi:pyridoxamine 5'-phosphate oxidase
MYRMIEASAADPDPAGEWLGAARVDAGWLAVLRSWRAEAAADARVVEPDAMQVATLERSGRPAVRTVLLKALDERGLVFYTNYSSAKAEEPAAHPYAAAVLVWTPLARQVRARGAVTRIDRAETEAYFATRPRGSQLGAWASPQSRVIASRAALQDAVAEVERRFTGGAVPTPPHWGGYRITPDEVEFWLGRPDRLHDRIRYRQDGTAWVTERLAP